MLMIREVIEYKNNKNNIININIDFNLPYKLKICPSKYLHRETGAKRVAILRLWRFYVGGALPSQTG